MGLLCCKHSWLSLSALEINKPFLILIKAKSFAIQWIFCYTVNPLMTKPREYKLSWPSLFGQDDWILALFFFNFFMDRDEVLVHKDAKKKKKNSADIQPFWPHAWSISHMNTFYSDPYKSGKGRQYKTCTSEPGICLTYKSVDFLFLVIQFMNC